MTDKELLELAAKAIKMPRQQWNYEWCRAHGHMVTQSAMWNPLTDDGDALRLAVKLNLVLEIYADMIYCYCETTSDHFEEPVKTSNDPYAATRRAIVRAAAEIGKTI